VQNSGGFGRLGRVVNIVDSHADGLSLDWGAVGSDRGADAQLTSPHVIVQIVTEGLAALFEAQPIALWQAIKLVEEFEL